MDYITEGSRYMAIMFAPVSGQPDSLPTVLHNGKECQLFKWVDGDRRVLIETAARDFFLYRAFSEWEIGLPSGMAVSNIKTGVQVTELIPIQSLKDMAIEYH